MHSVKNTAIAMILLGVSFTLYHISLNPSEKGEAVDPESNLPRDVQEYDLSELSVSADPSSAGSGFAKPSKLSPPAPNFSSRTDDPEPVASSSPDSDIIVRQKSEVDRDQGLIAALNRQSDFAPTPPPKAEPPSSLDAAVASAPTGDDFNSNRPAESNLAQNTVNQNPADSFNSPTSSPNANPQVKTKSQSDFDPGSFASNSASANQTSNTNDFAPMTANPIGSTSLSDSQSHSQASAAEPAPTSNSSFEAGFVDPKVSTGVSEVSLENLTFSGVWAEVDRWISAGQFRTALQALSQFYHDDSLSGPQRQRLIGWLDALAAKVIFSTEDHLSGQAYTTKAEDTLEQLSASWQVPSQLIANINQENLAGSNQLKPGTRLKQISGPFDAQLELDAGVMTLFLDGLYAGRFAVTIGTSGQPRPGTYEVVLKSEEGYTWRDAEGRDYPPNSPENGYGPHWMGLSGSLCIHAVPESTRDGHRGCIGLSPRDAADLFVILSEGSELTILP